MSAMPGFLDDLRWRGLVSQVTDEAALAAHLAGGVRTGYVGFDPTADSLTIGNLVGIMSLVRLVRSGHRAVAVMGGGTGLIGDPSGKSAERQLSTRERVADNVRAIQGIFDRVMASAGAGAGLKIVNNVDWLGRMSWLDALRDVGKHFSVNQMIQRDSVKARLETREQGISYTEFSYMLLQAYDFDHLHRELGVTLQMGGSDQWGNIVSGIDLIRRRVGAAAGEQAAAAEPAFGLTWPLVTKADGTKFGKTESGAVWLTAPAGPSDTSPARTSAYAYWQFWMNAADDDVERFLKIYTLLGKDEIDAIMLQHRVEPGVRAAQRRLAHEATALLHGKAAAEHAEKAAAALFSGDVKDLPREVLEAALSAAPSTKHPRAQLDGEGVALVDLLAQTSLAQSKSQARQYLTEGSVSINGEKAAMGDRLDARHLLHGNVIALRRGKKTWHVTRWE